MTTAHERYEQQVHDGSWRAYNDLTVDNQRRQIAGLAAERDALAAALAAKQVQTDALLAERAALRERVEALQLSEWRACYGLEETEKMLNDTRTQVDALIAERAALCDQVDGLRSTLACARDISDMRVTLACARDTSDKWRRAHAEQLESNQDLREVNERLQTRCEELAHENAQLQREIDLFHAGRVFDAVLAQLDSSEIMALRAMSSANDMLVDDDVLSADDLVVSVPILGTLEADKRIPQP